MCGRWLSSRVVRKTIEQVEQGIRDRVQVKSLVDLVEKVHLGHTAVAAKNDLPDFVFVCARLFKMCNRSAKDRAVMVESAKKAVTAVGGSVGESADEISRFLWACGVLGIKPIVPEAVVKHYQEKCSNKDLCNAIWALSKWAVTDEEKKVFEAIVALLSEDRVESLSNEDLTAVVRAIAQVSQN